MDSKVCLSIDEKKYTYDIVKTFKNEMGMEIFRLKVKVANTEYTNKHDYDCMEYAIIDLQKQLPNNIQIVCCESCKHGNFHPAGNDENKIFCLRDYTPHNKSDVAGIFIDDDYSRLPKNTAIYSNELLHWCDKYDRINDNYYTYNDWISILERS